MAAVVTVADVDVSCWVLDPVQISWGRRGDPGEQPDAATLAATMRPDDTGTPPPVPQLGARVLVDVTHEAWVPLRLFVGTITDVALELDQAGALTVSLVAADPLALLAGSIIGDEPWPAESASARLTRVEDAVTATYPGTPAAHALAGCGYWSANDWPALNTVQVLAADVDRRPALDVLRDVAAAVDGFVHCAPILFAEDVWGQVLVDPNRWLDPATAWAPDPCTIPTDGLRQWTNRTQLVTLVAVGYGVDAGGGEQPTVTAVDEAAVAQVGPRAAHYPTILVNVADASALATTLVTAYAAPATGVDGLTYPVGWDSDLDTWLSLRDRRTATLIVLPAPDGTTHEWVVQGGVDDVGPDGVTRTLDLSDTPAYVRPLSWDGVDAAELWDTTAAAVRWDDVRDTWPDTPGALLSDPAGMVTAP